MHCGYCKLAGHNRSGCSQLKCTILRETEEEVHVEENEEEVQEQENVEEEHAGTDDQPDNNTEQPTPQTKRGRNRKPTDKMLQQIEEMMEKANKKKSKMVVDESGDVDFPVILKHIKHKTMRPQMDPTQVKESMVHILSHEGPTKGVPISRAHIIPEENAFVVQSRTNISVSTGGAHPATASTTTGVRGAHLATASTTN
ncbi:hypothetical protein D1007_46968 [Hordeum vulgare]|nr:hypothetical protein D1007_46968 [Hordeum vulgare]